MKNVQIIKDIEPTLNELIFADQKRLKQILFNLIGNAIKFTQRGSITIKVRKLASLRDDDEEDSIEFNVIDTGIGIAQDDQGKLFKLFSKLDVKNGINQNGVGLGLTISKRLVEQMGGSISLSSLPSCGTTFTFTIKSIRQ